MQIEEKNPSSLLLLLTYFYFYMKLLLRIIYEIKVQVNAKYISLFIIFTTENKEKRNDHQSGKQILHGIQ